MLVGCHALVWTGDFEGDGASLAVQKTQQAGFDLIEFPVMDPWRFNTVKAKQALERTGLKASASLGLSTSTDIASESTETVRRGSALLHSALDVAAALGSSYLCGVLYSAMQKYAAPATRQGLANSVSVIQEVADDAADKGITLGLEVVNRYESNLINTADQALRYIDLVGRPNVAVHLDTYHMNIEETDSRKPVVQCGNRLGYVHVGENHRGYLGSGSVRLGQLFRALQVVGFDGPIVFESFSSAVVDAHLSNALGIWREMWTDGDDLGRHAAGTIRALIAAASHAERTGFVLPNDARSSPAIGRVP